jgi:hypothetical protein
MERGFLATSAFFMRSHLVESLSLRRQGDTTLSEWRSHDLTWIIP